MAAATAAATIAVATEAPLKETHIVFAENQRGVNFDKLFGSDLKDAGQITITDPYVRVFHQIRNLMELMETIARNKANEEEIKVHLITIEDEFRSEQQTENLQKIADSCSSVGIKRSEEHTSELQSLMRISYAVFCMKKKNKKKKKK